MYNKAEGDIRTGSSYKGGLAVWHYYDDHAVSSTSIKSSQIPRPDRLFYDNPNIQVASDDAARKLLISRTDPLCYDNENIARWIEGGRRRDECHITVSELGYKVGPRLRESRLLAPAGHGKRVQEIL